MTSSGKISCSGIISNAEINNTSNPTLTVKITQDFTISKTHCLLIYVSDGAIKLGDGNAWGAEYFSSVIAGAPDASGHKCYAIYDPYSNTVPAGTYNITLAASPLTITSVTIGNPQSAVSSASLTHKKSIPCSGDITSASLDTSGTTPVLKITTKNITSLSSTNAILVYTDRGYMVPGSGQAWGSPDFNEISMGAYTAANGMCWGIYDKWATPNVSEGTYSINLSASKNLNITKVTVGDPGSCTAGTIDNSTAILGTTGNGPITFTVVDGPITLVNDPDDPSKNQSLLLTLKNAGCNTGPSQCWGGNVGTTFKVADTTESGYANSSSPAPSSNYYQYRLYPDLFKGETTARTVILTPGNYNASISVTGGAQLVNLTSKSYTAPSSDIKKSDTKYTGTLPLQVGYIQLSGEHPVNSSTMPKEGLASCNIIVLAFAGTDNSSGTPVYLDSPPKHPMNFYNECKYIASLVPKSAQIFYSVGGANITNATINAKTVDKIVSSVHEQVKSLSSYFTQGITGIDLDLEGGWPNISGAIDSQTIADLLDGFKSKGYSVSLAPQIVSTDGKNIDSTNPCTNLGLASGGTSAHQYNDAIRQAKHAPDYLFIQCYNTGGFTIDGYSESDIKIFKAAYSALNNLVATTYDASSAPMSISNAPDVQIAIGFPCNAGAGNHFTIYQPELFEGVPISNYNQSTVLDKLKESIDSEKWDKNVKGIMMWSLNNDYMPKWFQDNYAVTGGFCQKIFNAKSVSSQPDVPYMTLTLQYGAPASIKGGVIMTIITPQKEYLIFGTPDGNGGSQPMVTSDAPALWTTITPISKGLITKEINTKFNVAESGSLDVIASDTSPKGYDCTLMVSLYAKGEKDPNAKPLMQSQPLPVTLYENADNVATVVVYNDDDSELPPFSSDFNPPKNGKFILTVRNQKGSGTQKPSSAGAEFWWSPNVPSQTPAWLGRIMNVFAEVAINAGLTAIGGAILPLLVKTAEAAAGVQLKFTTPNESKKTTSN